MRNIWWVGEAKYQSANMGTYVLTQPLWCSSRGSAWVFQRLECQNRYIWLIPSLAAGHQPQGPYKTLTIALRAFPRQLPPHTTLHSEETALRLVWSGDVAELILPEEHWLTFWPAASLDSEASQGTGSNLITLENLIAIFPCLELLSADPSSTLS